MIPSPTTAAATAAPCVFRPWLGLPALSKSASAWPV
nr:MAG TPA: hypothetical protein [Caudoviricetes sp.]